MKREIDPLEISSSKKFKPYQFPELILPNEIWLKILHCLKTKDLFGSFAFVCKHFHNLTLDSKTVKILSLNRIKTRQKYLKVLNVLNRSKNLYEFKIENSSQFYDKLILYALKSNPKLKSLKILSQTHNQKNSTLSEEVIQAIGEDLEHLELFGIDHPNDELMKKISILENLKSLKMVVPNLCLKNLIDIGINCSKLEKVHFDWIKLEQSSYNWENPQLNISANDIIDAYDKFFKERKETLKSVFIGRIDTNIRCQVLKNLVLCENLEELIFDNAGCVDNFGLDIISKLSSLKCLQLPLLCPPDNDWRGKTIHNVNLLFKGSNLTNLTYIYITENNYLAEDFLKNITGYENSKLMKIFIHGCSNLKVQESTLRSLAANVQSGAKRVLGLEWKNICKFPDSRLLEINNDMNIKIRVGNSWISMINIMNSVDNSFFGK